MVEPLQGTERQAILVLEKGPESMSFFGDTSETVSRFSNHIEEFQRLYRRHGLDFGTPKNIWRFVTKLGSDRAFQNDLSALGNSVIRREGGKVSLTILFTIIAISIGGIGIAAMGSAVGLPAAALATVLGTIGFGIGQEIDTAINSPSKYEQSSGNSETAGTRESNQDANIRPPNTAPPVDCEPHFDSTSFAVAEILQSLDAVLTPIAVTVSDSRSQLQNVSRLVDQTHLAAIDTYKTGVELRDKLFPELARIIESQEKRTTDAISQQTEAIRRLTLAAYVLAIGIVLSSLICVVIARQSHLRA